MNESYYSKSYIGHLIREGCINRDVAILPALRGAKIANLDGLKQLLDLTNWDKRRLNLYISCAKVKEIPFFTFNLKRRSESTSEWFTNTYDSLVYEYDLFFDFDGVIEDVLKDVNTLKSFLDDYKVPYQLIFSGNKGFHVVIDGKYLKIGKIDNGNVFPHKTIAELIKQTLKLDTLDLSNNGVTNRLRKVPYSLVLPKRFKDTPEFCQETIMNVAFPIDDLEFKNFKQDRMMLCNIYKNYELTRRGKEERFKDLTEKEKLNNVKNFIEEFNFK